MVYTRPPRVDVTAGTSSEGSAVAVSESTSPTDESTPTIPPLSAKRKSFSHTDPEVLTTGKIKGRALDEKSGASTDRPHCPGFASLQIWYGLIGKANLQLLRLPS